MSLSLQRRLVLNFFLVSLASMLVVVYIPLRSYNLVLERENEKKLFEVERSAKKDIRNRVEEACEISRDLVNDATFVKVFQSHQWTSAEELKSLYSLPPNALDNMPVIARVDKVECLKMVSNEQPPSEVLQILEYEKHPDRYFLGRFDYVMRPDDSKLFEGGIVVGEPFTTDSFRHLLGKTDVEAQLVNADNKAFLNSLPATSVSQLRNTQSSVYMSEIRMVGSDLRYQARLVPIVNQHGELAKIIFLKLAQPAALTAWSQLTSHFLISILAGIAIALVTGYVVSRSISRPVRILASGVREAADGNLGQYIVSERSDDVGELARNFNIMTERLRASLRQLQERAKTIEDSNVSLEKALEELTLMRDYMENILTSIKSGVVTVDLNMEITTANSAASEILGVKKIPHGVASNVLDESILRLVREGLTRGRTYGSHEMTLERDDGQRTLDVSTSLLKDAKETIGVVVTFRDLTEIKALEEQVRRQDRLAAMGQLSAGVAHEIRNPLGIIKGSAEILKKRFDEHPEEEGLTGFIIDEVNRLSKVVTNFLDFARPKSPVPEEININALLEYTVDLLDKQKTAKKYRVLRQLHPEPLIVNVDRAQFQQVFLNLMLNGMDAMPDGGVINVRTHLNTSDNSIVVELQDHGEGIAKSDLQKIFNPFFTTKEEGTGLGLSIVHSIVEAHGAVLKVDSVVGQGSTFRIVFPSSRHKSSTVSEITAEEKR